MTVIGSSSTLSGVDFDLTQAHVSGRVRLDNDVSGLWRVAAFHADCRTCHLSAWVVVTTHRVTAKHWTHCQRVSVRNTDRDISRYVPYTHICLMKYGSH